MLFVCAFAVHEVKNDILYLQKYYPLDYAIHNKGFLTLVSPLYITYFSKFLKLIRTELSNKNPNAKESLPDKTKILKALKTNVDSKKLAKNMAEFSKTRVIVSELNVDTRIELVWEPIDRVLNALIGDQVLKYRSEYLTRVNDRKFRDELAIMAEKGLKKFKNA